jgi:hypothetical protein
MARGATETVMTRKPTSLSDDPGANSFTASPSFSALVKSIRWDRDALAAVRAIAQASVAIAPLNVDGEVSCGGVGQRMARLGGG